MVPKCIGIFKLKKSPLNNNWYHVFSNQYAQIRNNRVSDFDYITDTPFFSVNIDINVPLRLLHTIIDFSTDEIIGSG